MPQTSPMNWNILSLVSILSISIMLTMGQKKYKNPKMNKIFLSSKILLW